jgi:protein-disulfide isomerase
MRSMTGTLWVLGLFFLVTLTSSSAVGQVDKAVDEESLVRKIKDEIMKELREGDFLREQIESGIKDYVKRQQEAQVAARAETERLANEKAKNIRPVSRFRDHIYGDIEAGVSLVEYSDFECPFCKSFHSTAKEIVDKYKGRVNWVYRHFPLSIHNPVAQREAEASECANELGGNNAFWNFADEIYARTGSNGKGVSVTDLVGLAKENGLDEEQFRSCLASNRYTSRVNEDFEEGTRIGITGTPTNFLLSNMTGELIIKRGAHSFSELKPDMDKLLSGTVPKQE